MFRMKHSLPLFELSVSPQPLLTGYFTVSEPCRVHFFLFLQIVLLFPDCRQRILKQRRPVFGIHPCKKAVNHICNYQQRQLG